MEDSHGNCVLGLSGSDWFDLGISLSIVLAVLLLGRWIVRWVVDKAIRRFTSRTKTELDDVLVDVLRMPFFLLTLVLSLEIALKRLDFLPESWETWKGDLFFVLYLVVGFIFAWRFVHNFFIWYGKEMSARIETDLDQQLMPFFRRIAMIILWMIGIITILGHFEVDVSAMVTTLGIGSLAVALAAKESLADMISGFLIMIDRPFRIGDRVEIHIGLDYGIEIEKARKLIVDAVRNVEGVLPHKPVEALFLEFGASALIFRVRWWLDSYYDTRRMFDKVNTAIYNVLNEANIEFPYPQIEVSHKINKQNRDGISSVFRG